MVSFAERAKRAPTSGASRDQAERAKRAHRGVFFHVFLFFEFLGLLFQTQLKILFFNKWKFYFLK